MKRFVVLLLAASAGSLALAQASAGAAEAAPGQTPAPVQNEEPLQAPAATPVQAEPVAPVVASETPALPPEPVLAVEPAVTPAVAPAVTRKPGLAPPLPYVPAGRWEGEFSAAHTASFGNTSGQSLTLGTDATYTRPDDKLSLSAQYLESSARSTSNGTVTSTLTALQWRLGGRYDRDLNARDFGFVGLDFSHDRIRELALRSVVSSGLGRHLVKDAYDQWDVYAGLTWREDVYNPPGVEIDGAQRTHYNTLETLLGQESTHKLSETARVKQKFVLYPALGNYKGTRATLDAGLQVDLNKTFSLSIKVQGRYDSLAEAPAEKYDLLFITGLSMRFGR